MTNKIPKQWLDQNTQIVFQKAGDDYHRITLLINTFLEECKNKNFKLSRKEIGKLYSVNEVSYENIRRNLKKYIQEHNLKYSIKKIEKKANKKFAEEAGYNIDELLRNSKLLSIIEQELKKRVVGEEIVRKAIFISCCSIFCENIKIPPNVFITSESSAGKSYIAEAVYDLFPDNRKVYRTKISPEVFTYWHNSKFEPEWTWNGKLFYLNDPKNSLLNSDTFKVMMSEGSSSTVVINQRAIDIDIKGKPMILLTTAHTKPKTEIINRFNVISLDESAEQTHEILKYEADEDIKGETENYDKNLKIALSRLGQVKVKIPYAQHLVGFFPIGNIRVRRDFKRFLNIIKSCTALHQFQRNKEDDFVLANDFDYEVARVIFSKMQSNDLMVALTHKLKKAYDTCLTLTDDQEWFSVKQAHAANPKLSSLKHWYDLIDDLAQNNLLDAKIDETVAASRAPTLYKVKKYGSLILPEFKKIIENNKIG